MNVGKGMLVFEWNYHYYADFSSYCGCHQRNKRLRLNMGWSQDTHEKPIAVCLGFKVIPGVGFFPVISLHCASWSVKQIPDIRTEVPDIRTAKFHTSLAFFPSIQSLILYNKHSPRKFCNRSIIWIASYKWTLSPERNLLWDQLFSVSVSKHLLEMNTAWIDFESSLISTKCI